MPSRTPDPKSTARTAPAIRANGRKILILCANQFEDSELIYPYYRLQAEGFAIDLATPKGETITGKHGVPMQGTCDIADAKIGGYDALVLPGGNSPDQLRRDNTAAKIVAQALKKGVPVAAICHGPQLLCSVPAELRGGRTVTSWISVKDDLVNAGFAWIDEPVVLDDNLITSRIPRDLPAFCETLIALLAGDLERPSNGVATKSAAKRTKKQTARA